MNPFRDTVLAVLVRKCSRGQLQFGLIWSGKAQACGECTHTFVGGGVESGESAEEALKRELRQEVGLLPGQYQLRSISHGPSDFTGPAVEDGRTKRYRFFLVHCHTGAVLQQSPEAPAAGWFTPQQIIAIAEQGFSANKRTMISAVSRLLLQQYPDLFRGSESLLRQMSQEIAPAG